MIPSLENHLFSNLPENTGTYGKRKMSFSLLSVRGQHLEFLYPPLTYCVLLSLKKRTVLKHIQNKGTIQFLTVEEREADTFPGFAGHDGGLVKPLFGMQPRSGTRRAGEGQSRRLADRSRTPCSLGCSSSLAIITTKKEELCVMHMWHLYQFYEILNVDFSNM